MPPEDEIPADAEALALLDAYLQELHAGRQPNRDRLLAEHPELAELVCCLESLHRLVPPFPLVNPEDAPAAEDALGSTMPALPTTGATASLPEFGNYELLGEIGRGGMGVVYRARQKDLDRLVAIKMILASNLASEEQVQRFHAEARAAARLQHPHIVQIHEAGQIHGQHYFVMEYVDGPSLADLIAKKLPVPEESARLLVAVARAVDHLHTQGIVHRDLKPSNVLLASSSAVEAGAWVPKVSDFGLVKMLGAGSDMTHSGAVIGTPSYMAPEQAAGRSAEVTPRSDVYGLGAILYEMLTGRPPFRENTPLDTLVQVLESEPTPPRKHHPHLPPELEMICLKCLEKSPENRYPSARALADDLERFLKGETVEARPQGFLQRLRRWARREPALATRLGALAVSAVVVHAHYSLFGGTPSSLHLKVLLVLFIWALASVVYQLLLRRERWSRLIQFAWAGTDVLMVTAILLLTDTLIGPLPAAYPLLVAGSGLWFHTRLIWFTTGAAEAAYAGLLLRTYLQNEGLPNLHHHVVFMIALAVLGMVTVYQVHRVRALSRYYEHRPLG